jgi:hypothetical protein
VPVRAALVLLFLLLGYAVSIATRTGLADAYAEPAKNYLQAKRDAGEELTQEEWQGIAQSLSRALELAPGDPRNISELARLNRIRLEANDLDARQILRYGDSAAGYYLAALARRPTWPWDWGDLALVKFQQYQDASRVYQDALARAVRFGPREPSLQELVAELGSTSWSTLNPAAALAVLTAADRALERDTKSLPEMSEAKARWQPLCARADDTLRHLKRQCKVLGMT